MDPISDVERGKEGFCKHLPHLGSFTKATRGQPAPCRGPRVWGAVHAPRAAARALCAGSVSPSLAWGATREDMESVPLCWLAQACRGTGSGQTTRIPVLSQVASPYTKQMAVGTSRQMGGRVKGSQEHGDAGSVAHGHLPPLPQLSSSHTGPSEAHTPTPGPLHQRSLLPLMSVAVPPQKPDPGHPLQAHGSCPVAVSTALSLAVAVTLIVWEQNRGGPSRLCGPCQPPFLASGIAQEQDGPPLCPRPSTGTLRELWEALRSGPSVPGRDAGHPALPLTLLSPDAQATPHCITPPDKATRALFFPLSFPWL